MYKEKALSNVKHYQKRANLNDLENRIRNYVAVLPVFGFNSQRYDMNVLKPQLMKILSEPADRQSSSKPSNGDDANADDADGEENDGEETTAQGRLNFVVKKQDSMTCVQTTTLRFLDARNFISPGFNYAAYLKAHGTHQAKGFFPYEWMDDPAKLAQTYLPGRHEFNSSLKGESISEEDYALVQRIWKERGMRTVKDLLVWYNNLDVEPFLEALQKQYDIYASRNIDMGRQAISLPGLAVLWMESVVGPRPSLRRDYQACSPRDQYQSLKSAVVRSMRVQLIDEDNKDLHQLFRTNLVGGPALVFHRYHARGTTRIRHGQAGGAGKFCQRIQGYDANALYLYCIAQDMPVGRPIRRLEQNQFRPSPIKNLSKTAQGWLGWMEFLSGNVIQTALNDREVRLGRHGLPVDGFDAETNTVYQFNGCYWHGHACAASNGRDIGKRDAASRLAETILKRDYLEHLGYRVVSVWECDWRKIVSETSLIKTFLKAYFDAHFGVNRAYTREQLIDDIASGKLFGFVECDVDVPEHLVEKFSEMSPIFKNVELSREDLSPHMREFAETNGFMSRPTRCLIGSMKARQQLFLTPLLRWYIQHGLIVGRVYQFIQYQPLPVFRPFADSVTSARRAGDVDADLRLLANNAKLVGNSMYGKTIINKTAHRDTGYTVDDRKVAQLIRSSRFHSLNIVDESLFETVCFKKKVSSHSFTSTFVVSSFSRSAGEP